MPLSDLDLDRGWYHCPGCGSEVLVWPMTGDTWDGMPAEPIQTHRDLCAECDDDT